LDLLISRRRGFLLSSQSILIFRQQHKRKRSIKAIASYPTAKDLLNAATVPLPGLVEISWSDAIISNIQRNYDLYSKETDYPIKQIKHRLHRLSKKHWEIVNSYPVARAWRYASRLQRHFPPGKTALERLVAGENHEVVLRDLKTELNHSVAAFTGAGKSACIPENI